MTWLVTLAADAAPEKARALPTWVAQGARASLSDGERRAPLDPADRELARRVDALVADGLEDAGLELQVRSTHPESQTSAYPGELELLTLGRQSLVVAPEVIRHGDVLMVRLVAASPSAKTLHVVVRELSPSELDVGTVVMVAELLRAAHQVSPSPASVAAAPEASAPDCNGGAGQAKAKRRHSPGRGVLTLASGLLGGAVGYSLQRASGSDDPRLTYPLIALGTGLGLGASMIAADEWDISVAEAWYLNAGMLWPASSGLLLARAYEVSPKTDRYAYGLAGVGIGLTLASLSISMTEITEGDAVLAHSGGSLGLFFGGLVDMGIEGKTEYVPWHGMGYGSALGVLAAGAAATQLHVTSSQMLFIDMGAGLGALTGAALGSPLLFVENDIPSSKRQRAWLAAVGGGALVGGVASWYLTRGITSDEHPGATGVRVWPYAEVARGPSADGETRGPDLALGVQGIF